MYFIFQSINLKEVSESLEGNSWMKRNFQGIKEALIERKLIKETKDLLRGP